MPKYKAEAQADRLIQIVQLEAKLEVQEVDLNSCREIPLLLVFIKHKAAQYLDTNHNLSIVEEVLDN